MKFSINAEPFTGQVFELLAQDDLTWTEAGLLETVLGVSLVELDDAENGPRLRRSVRTLAAFLWASVHRLRPETTFAEVADTPQRSVTWHTDEPPDPTAASTTDPTTEKPDSSTSEPSPTTSESDPGNGDG